MTKRKATPPIYPWEIIWSDNLDVVERLEVEGGWLYRSTQERDGDVQCESMAFVPQSHRP